MVKYKLTCAILYHARDTFNPAYFHGFVNGIIFNTTIQNEKKNEYIININCFRGQETSNDK